MLHFFLSISRQLPNFKGKFRLMRFLLQSQLKSVSNIIVHAANGVLYKIPNINEIIGFSIYINGYYEKKYTNYFIESIPLNGVFIDVGANIGSICIPLAKARPDIAIIAIEASSKVLEYLRYNVDIMFL